VCGICLHDDRSKHYAIPEEEGTVCSLKLNVRLCPELHTRAHCRFCRCVSEYTLNKVPFHGLCAYNQYANFHATNGFSVFHAPERPAKMPRPAYNPASLP
jgi:hypothetical protein